MFESLREPFALPLNWKSFRINPKVVLTIIGVVIGAALLIWAFDKVFVYYFARSYVEQIAATLGLNKHLATALVWIVFAVTAFLFSCLVSFSRKRRSVGLAGLLVLVVGQSLILYWADKPFDANAQKC